jgi:DmsE family decaheme c-type cytochrome
MRGYRASAGCLLLLIGFTGTRLAAGQNHPSTPEAAAADAAGRETSGADQRLKPEPIAQCYPCHGDVKASFAQASHHPVEEGRVKCSDCHDPHDAAGGSSPRPIADQNAVCTRCHSETAGPFAYEHPVVKAEGCVSCHAPHGSPNAHLLKEGNVNTLCLQCHSATNASAFPHAVSPPGRAGSQAAQAAACTSCHTRIHGSNASDIFFE